MNISLRLAIVDIMKGFAILLVILGHVLSLGYSAGISPSFMQCEDILHGFHMPIFFVIAGFFVEKWTQQNFQKAIGKKFCRLMIPYFTWGFLFAIYKQIGGQQAMTPEGLKTFLYSPFQVWSSFWFVYVLFFINVIYYFVVHLFKDYKKGRFLFLLISIIAHVFIGVVPAFWIIKLLCKFMLFFAIGTYLLPVIKKEFVPKFSILLLSFALFAIINIFYLSLIAKGNNMELHFYKILTASVGCFTVFVLSSWLLKYCQFFSSIFKFYGEKSLQIYLFHPFIVGIGKVILKKLFGVQFLWFQVIFLFFITTIICGVVWKQIDENSKLYRIMFGVFKNDTNVVSNNCSNS